MTIVHSVPPHSTDVLAMPIEFGSAGAGGGSLAMTSRVFGSTNIVGPQSERPHIRPASRAHIASSSRNAVSRPAAAIAANLIVRRAGLRNVRTGFYWNAIGTKGPPSTPFSVNRLLPKLYTAANCPVVTTPSAELYEI